MLNFKSRPPSISVLFTLAVFIGCGTALYAPSTWGGVNCDQCVDTGDIAHHAVTKGKIAPASVGTNKIEDGAITAAKLERGVIALLDDLKARIATLETNLTTANNTISELQAALAVIQNNTVLDLDGLLMLDSTSGRPIARFQGVNVQVVNGLGQTDSINGLGNLIVGYDETGDGGFTCSIGGAQVPGEFPGQGNVEIPYLDQETCEANGGVWAPSHKTGSHYLIVGSGNNYSAYGGAVIGYRNTSNREYASVTGGTGNTASGVNSSVSGGLGNRAIGIYASVSGGAFNTASGHTASVSAGIGNTASGWNSSVSGGEGNTATSPNYLGADAGTGSTSVSGGMGNVANTLGASISGGRHNVAAGVIATSISGGNGCELHAFPGGDLAEWGVGDTDATGHRCAFTNAP
jgi:hypothetical protein